MALKRGKSKKVISDNIATEIRSGKKPKVAAAIAHSKARGPRKSRKMTNKAGRNR